MHICTRFRAGHSKILAPVPLARKPAEETPFQLRVSLDGSTFLPALVFVQRCRHFPQGTR